MTEFEINKAVAEKLELTYEVTRYGVVTRMSNKEQWRELDPCNNVEQAWEIMLKYNICVAKGEFNYYDAVHNLEYYTDGNWTIDTCISHEKPLVSAMLCFLEINK